MGLLLGAGVQSGLFVGLEDYGGQGLAAVEASSNEIKSNCYHCWALVLLLLLFTIISNCIAFSWLPLSPATEHEVNWTFISTMKVLDW